MDDAVLSVGAEDNLSPVLMRMSAQVRAFGKQVGAEAKNIDKAVRDVSKSMHRLGSGNIGAGGANIGTVARSNTRALREQAAVIAANRAEVQRLSRAAGAVPSATSFSGFRDARGRGISVKEINEYNAAVKRLAESERVLQRIHLQGQKQGGTFRPMTPAVPVGFKQYQQQLQQTQQAAAAAANTINKTSWWPPKAFQGPKQFGEQVAQMSNAVRYAMYDVSRSAAIAGAAFLALGVMPVVLAAKWQRAFADVERTVQTTPLGLERIREGLKNLSQDIPVAFADLAEIASVGGQMGIAADGIVNYTETIAKLTATTNLTADSASKALGRFKALFAEADNPALAVTDRTFSNLASSILKVGVNSVATESGIVNVSTQISSMGQYAGFTADQIIGLAGALSSVGVPPELSRGVITRLFNTIGEAVSAGGVSLKDFAGVAGVSANEFAEAWKTDRFAPIFVQFIQGLGKLSDRGGDAVATLHELGITSVRDVPVLLRLATAAGEAGTAGSLLAQTMRDARSGWVENIELAIQYNKIASTLSERSKLLIQNFEALMATMGRSSTGPLKAVVDFLTQVVKGFDQIIDTDAGQVFGVAAVSAGLLAGTLLLLAAAGARSFAAMQGLAAGITAVTGSAAVASTAVRILSATMIGLGAVGAILAVVGVIAAIATGAKEAQNAITDTQGALAAMKADAQAGSGFAITQGLKDARTEAQKTSSQAENLGIVLGHTAEDFDGLGSAAAGSARNVEDAALRFGDATKQFARSALTSNQEFQKIFDAGFGGEFAERLRQGGFDIDKALSIAARGDREAVRQYVEDVFGEFESGQTLPWNIDPAIVQARELENRANSLVDVLFGTGQGLIGVANQAYATGEAFVSFSNATEMTTDKMEEFRLQNEDVINSMADGFAQFVDSGTLIKLAQQFAAIAEAEAGEDREAAAKSFEDAWTDAYGGTKFSIEDYMSVFRRAADEQTQFINNLRTLSARGVPDDIIADLAEQGPKAQQMVRALIDSTDAQLQEYVNLYGQTGQEAMVALAAQQLAAEYIVRNVMATVGINGVKELNRRLTEGASLEGALEAMQLQADGNPIEAPTKARMDYYAEQRKLQDQAYRLGIGIPVTPYLTKTAIRVEGGGAGGGGGVKMQMYDRGGFTGRGYRYTPRGIVHAGEYVHKKSDVDQRTGRPKPEALLRLLSGGRAARGGGPNGYDVGGFVTGGGTSVVSLSMEDRRLLMAIADRVGLTIQGGQLTSIVNGGNANSSARRVS